MVLKQLLDKVERHSWLFVLYLGVGIATILAFLGVTLLFKTLIVFTLKYYLGMYGIFDT